MFWWDAIIEKHETGKAIKWKKVSKNHVSEIRGTKKYENMAKKQKVSKSYFDETKCTKKHETGKAIKQALK